MESIYKNEKLKYDWLILYPIRIFKPFLKDIKRYKNIQL